MPGRNTITCTICDQTSALELAEVIRAAEVATFVAAHTHDDEPRRMAMAPDGKVLAIILGSAAEPA